MPSLQRALQRAAAIFVSCFFQAEDGIRVVAVTGVQTCALPICDNGKYAYVADRMPDAVKALAHDLLMIEAQGDYDGAKAFVEKYGEMPTEMKEALDSLSDIPTDIRPSYLIEKQMASWWSPAD